MATTKTKTTTPEPLRLVDERGDAGLVVLAPEDLRTLHRLAELRNESAVETLGAIVRLTLEAMRGV